MKKHHNLQHACAQGARKSDASWPRHSWHSCHVHTFRHSVQKGIGDTNGSLCSLHLLRGQRKQSNRSLLRFSSFERDPHGVCAARTCSTGTRQRSNRSLHRSSNLARVRLLSMCFGPSAVAVMNGSEMDVCASSQPSQPRKHDRVKLSTQRRRRLVVLLTKPKERSVLQKSRTYQAH